MQVTQTESLMLRGEWLRLNAIVEAQQAVAEAGLDLKTVMKIIAERMQDITSATGGVIELVEGDEMVYHAVSGSVSAHPGLRLKKATSLSGLCVQTGDILRCDDTETDDRVNREACRRLDIRSMIVVPLHHKKNVVGVLKVLASEPQFFNNEDLQTLQLMSALVGNVLGQAEQYEAEKTLFTERAEALEALYESEERFRNSFDAAAIGKAIVGLDGRWTKVNQALCDLVGYGETELLALTFQDITHPDDLTTDLSFVMQLLEGTLQSYQMEKRYFHKDGQIIWVLLSVSIVCDRDRKPLYFVSEILDITGQKQAMQLLLQANEELENLAFYDALTGVHNRRAFDERLAEEIAFCRREGTIFSLAIFDLDHFKRLNDTYGHATGDEVLSTIGRLMRSSLHARDFFARYGGEEFALILPRTGAQGAIHVAERLRRVIAAHPWPCGTLTASFGIATWTGETAQVLLLKADHALYEVKGMGRNSVRHCDENDSQGIEVCDFPDN